MKKRTSASSIMRLVSIVGIICLLALQWVWWGNAYRAVEMDMMGKADECVRNSIERAIIYQLDSTSRGIRVVNEGVGEVVPKKVTKMPSKHVANNTKELLLVLEEGLFLTNKPISDSLIHKQLNPALNDKFGYIPEHSIKVVRQSLDLDSLEVKNYNRIAIGKGKDTIYQQIGYKSYVAVVFESPITEFLRKGTFIMIFSILLVLLIGWILIFQLLNMQRERKFSNFIIDYTRMMTHDLKIPVSGIQMIFKMYQKKGTSVVESQDKYLVEGDSLTKKILLNLDNILYMAKSEQMELPVNLIEIQIREFMERTVQMYRMRNYNPKTVVIETIYEPTDFKCRMDIGLMENVMCNLLENAIKYTPQEALIEIRCTKVDNNVVFSIRDNGMGMKAEDQKRIFDLFERGSANKNSNFPGFGIGLHFVERAVKAHGGKITVQSEVGKGTTFTIKYTSLEFF